MVTTKWTFDEYKEEGTDFVDTVQATNVKIQGKEIATEKEYTPTFVPYLVWIPSKKKKVRSAMYPLSGGKLQYTKFANKERLFRKPPNNLLSSV